MTENEEKFLQMIREKADALDKRAERFENHLQSIEDEMKAMKKTLAYVKHKIGEHDEKLFHLSAEQRNGFELHEIKEKIEFLTQKTSQCEQEIYLLKKRSQK